MPPVHPITPVQERVLALMSVGCTATAAARIVGVHRNTIGYWLRSAIFREALLQAQRDQSLAWREQARLLSSQALGVIQAVLADPNAPAGLRLEAALAVHGAQPTEAPKKSPAPPSTGPSRNRLCPCGSGRKYKRCCMSSD